MQAAIKAADSDLFDVLAYVAFASAPRTREERAAAARQATATEFTDPQRAFVDFVLAQYVRQGVDGLGAEKLLPLLKLKYRNTLADAFAELGQPDPVRDVFVGFRRHLYGAHIGGRGASAQAWPARPRRRVGAHRHRRAPCGATPH
jgi:type I restriction enzyme, R subunit